MKIKQITLTAVFLLLMGNVALSEDLKHHSMNHKAMHDSVMNDSRVSLNLPPMMKHHQLANMRDHLDAIRKIIASLSEEDFTTASNIASQQLGSTKAMMTICNNFENEDFKTMGLAFHRSADKLAETLKEGNINTSLRALKITMNSCVNCHATFKQ